MILRPLSSLFEGSEDTDPKKILVPDTVRRTKGTFQPHLYMSIFGKLLRSEIRWQFKCLLSKNKPKTHGKSKSLDSDSLESLWKLYLEARRREQPKLVSLNPIYGTQFMILIYQISTSDIWTERADRIFNDWFPKLEPRVSKPSKCVGPYSLILNIHSKHGDLGRLEKRLSELFEKYGEDAVMSKKKVLNAAAICHAKIGQPEKAEELLQKWMNHTYNQQPYCSKDATNSAMERQSTPLLMTRPTIAEYIWALREIFYAYGRLGDVENMAKMLADLKAIPNALRQLELNALLDAVTKRENVSVDDIDEIYKEIFSSDIRPDKGTFNILINMSLQRNELDVARKWLTKMKEHKYDPDVYTYTTILSSYLARGQMKDAESIIHEMQEKSIRPNAITLHALMNGFYKHNQIQNTMDHFRYFARSWDPDYKPKDTQLLKNTEGFEANHAVIPIVAPLVLKSSMTDPTKWSSELILLIKIISKTLPKPSPLIYRILSDIPNTERLISQPSFKSFNSLRNLLVLSKDRPLKPIRKTDCKELLIKTSKLLQTSRPIALAILLEYAIINGRVDTAHILLSSAGSCLKHSPILKSMQIKLALRQHKPDLAISLATSYYESSNMKSVPSLAHFTLILGDLTNKRLFSMATQVEPNVVKLLQKYPDIKGYNALLNYYAESRMVPALESAWENMNKSNVKPGLLAYNNLIKGYSLSEAHQDRMVGAFNELLANDLIPDRRTILSLVRSHCLFEKPHRAILLIERAAIQWGIQPTTTVINMLLKSFGRRNTTYASCFHLFNSMLCSWIQGDSIRQPHHSDSWSSFNTKVSEHFDGLGKTDPVETKHQDTRNGILSRLREKPSLMFSWLSSRDSSDNDNAKRLRHSQMTTFNESQNSPMASIRKWTHKSSLVTLKSITIPPPDIVSFKDVLFHAIKYEEWNYMAYLWLTFMLWSRSSSGIPDSTHLAPYIQKDQPLIPQLKNLCKPRNKEHNFEWLCQQVNGLIEKDNLKQKQWFSEKELMSSSYHVFVELGQSELAEKISSIANVNKAQSTLGPERTYPDHQM
ncbi:hypothetical protein H4219_002962 [Mycoemilia scoparia]|uniref:Pentacotripeptide-repeat region of PRORP domain-containing protein n=1 Tax=Mycoemilia scoparia TaxID=417184 RepID=A0A9W7ZW55_9FUNG|nr:hypothetical protein H4219_002962 [Mycoemilia scoparia]